MFALEKIESVRFNKIHKSNQTPRPHQLIQDVSVAPGEHLNQTTRTPIQQSKTPQNILCDPFIINLIHRTQTGLQETNEN